jgi:uncharacterized protein YlxW (UPF0749 family)
MGKIVEPRVDAGPESQRPASGPSRRRHPDLIVRGAVALMCGVLGLVLVAQVRATEQLGERLAAEREEDLTRILADLSVESDRLQSEITDLRLTLLAYETTQEREQLTLRNLQRRLDDLRILAGVVPAEGEGVLLSVSDPALQVTQEVLVDTVQELRDAGAEAIAVNGVRLLVSSSFTTRNNRLVLDGRPLGPPYRVAAVGPGETMAKALAIPGGALDGLHARLGVEATVEVLAELTVPARAELPSFLFGEPVPAQESG